MTGLISRKLYELLMFLYPADFRREFGDEMLNMFEECRTTQGCCPVLADVLRSAAKQRIHHFSAVETRDEALCPDIGAAPRLARMLAVSVFILGLSAGVLGHRGQSHNRNSWTLARSEVRFWFPTGTAVMERKSNAPDSWIILRAERSCGR